MTQRNTRNIPIRTIKVALAGLAASLAATLAMPDPALAMSKYRWKNRPLLVFAPNAESAKLARQRALLERRIGAMRERDMVLIYVIANRVVTRLGRDPGRSAAALRRRFGVARNGFRTVLVGKDTGTKLSSRAPVPAQRIFRLIDSMPMRRNEMRRRGR